MTVEYCTPQDVYALGLSAAAFVRRPRVLDPSTADFLDPVTGIFTQAAHDLVADDRVRVVLVAKGGALPTGIDPTVIYTPIVIDFWRFQLSLDGSTPITFGDTGTSTNSGASSWGILADPERRLRRIILSSSAELDQDLTAHTTPIQIDPATGRYPEKLIGMTARVSARAAMLTGMFENALAKKASDRLEAQEKRDDEQRRRWFSGEPLKPPAVDQTPEIPDNGPRASNVALATCRPAMIWVRGTL